MCFTVTEEVVVKPLILQSILKILHIFAYFCIFLHNYIGEQIIYLLEFYKMDHEGRLVLMDLSINLDK
jgi:hypothetical protein